MAVETSTDGSGRFFFASLIPGNYRVKAVKAGFKSVEVDNLKVSVNAVESLQLELKVGDQKESLTVEASTVTIQAQTSEISLLIGSRQVQELPLNGRNFQKLVLLAPGVGGQGGTTPNNPSISGARPVNNNYTIDGIGSNDERLAVGFVGLSNGSGTDIGNNAPNMISTEAIQEFRLISSNADATFGRGSGAQINIVSKGGGNAYHGSAYEYLRNDAMDARDFFNYGPFFDQDRKAKTPPYKQNLFGGTFGGRLRRDRDFFFSSYEGLIQRRREQSAVTTTVPNADLIRFVPGDLGRYLRTYYIDRGIVPASGNPTGNFAPLPAADRAAAIQAGFAPQFFDGVTTNGEAGTVAISTAPPRNVDQHGFQVRTDHRLTERLTAMFRYSLTQPKVLAGTSAIALNLQEGLRRYQQEIAQFTYTASPRQILEARLGLLRNRFEQQGVGGQIDPRLTALGISPSYGAAISAGALFAANVNSAFIDNQTTPQTSVMHSWNRSNLTLRTGIEMRWIQLNVANISSGTPSYTFSASPVGANGILGSSPAATQAVALSARLSAYGVGSGPTTPMRGYRSSQYEYFSQADWRVNSSLTLNLGLRHSIFTPYGEANGTISNLYPGAENQRGSQILLIGSGRPFYNPDRNNFQPRLGFAWTPFASGRSVLRGSWGVYFDRVTQLQFTGVVTNVPYALSSDTANVPFVLGATVPITAAANPAITAVDPNLRNPRMARWNIAWEQQFGATTSVSAAYVGADGADLFSQTQINGFGGVPQSQRPDPRFSTQAYVGNLGESSYHSLQITARHRMTKSLDVTAAYTWAESRDNTSRESFGTVPTLLNLGASTAAGFQGGGSQFTRRPLAVDFGFSEFDVTHNLTFSYLYELPLARKNRLLGGWTVSGFAVLRSGEPVNVTRGIDYNDDGDISADRPQLLGARLSDVRNSGGTDKAQVFVQQAQALQILNTPTSAIDLTLPIPRNAFRAPAIRYFDLSLAKRFTIREGVRLSIEANAFNVFNQVALAAPVANLSSALFGRVTQTLAGSNPRQIQLGVKLAF